MKLIHQIEKYRPGNEQEEADKNLILQCLKQEKDIFSRNNPLVHMTAGHCPSSFLARNRNSWPIW